MASGYAPWFKRKILFRTPLYKRCPGGNYHFFRDTHCFCRVNEYTSDWHGGIYLFETGEELEFITSGLKPVDNPNKEDKSMAGIDKICGTEKQLKEFRAWLSKNKPEYLCSVNDPDAEFYWEPKHKEDLVTISNFPEEADKWLYKNCPLTFITGRIHEQYGGDPNEAG